MSCKHGNADWKLDPCELCAEEVTMFNRAFEEGRQDVLSELRTKGTIYEAYVEEKIAALRADLETERQDANSLIKMLGFTVEQGRTADGAIKVATIRERVEELRKDAEMYRWLRHGDNDELVMRVTFGGGEPFLLRNEKLDAAIDAEIGRMK